MLLLLSAANTAIVAMIGLLYMTARDGEMPPQFKRLNRHGVPLYPLLIAVGLPVIVLLMATSFEGLAGLYAIGVVGAITVNLGSCTFNRAIGFTWYDRVLFGVTFVILFFVELTLAKTKPDALFFVFCVLGVGLALRAWTQKRAGFTTLTVTHQVAEMVSPNLVATMQPRLEEGQRSWSRRAALRRCSASPLMKQNCAKQLSACFTSKRSQFISAAEPWCLDGPKWQDDPEANAIMSLMLKLGAERDICVLPVYAVTEDTATTILDLAATLGVDFLIIGASQRSALAKLLRGSIATNVAQQLPDSIRLLILVISL